jgi:hypothetical protein
VKNISPRAVEGFDFTDGEGRSEVRHRGGGKDGRNRNERKVINRWQEA